MSGSPSRDTYSRVNTQTHRQDKFRLVILLLAGYTITCLGLLA